jgi:PAS domain S-box-containing protein
MAGGRPRAAGHTFGGGRIAFVRAGTRPEAQYVPLDGTDVGTKALVRAVRGESVPMIARTDLLEALPIAVYTTDAKGRITFFNEAAAELWGHRPQLGSDQWCGSWRLYWPDGRPLPHDECPMAMALKEGRPVRGVEAVSERPDGTRVPFLPFPTPLRNAAGRVIGAINLLMDLTDRHRAEMESAQLAAIVVSSDDAIISKTLDGRITSWNAGAGRIFGYTAEEIIGQSILRLIPPELQDEEQHIIAKLKRGERIEHYETVRLTKGGRRVDFSLTVSPLRDKAGNVIGASKVGRDISERKQAERLQRLLIDELNHRIKNTLATVQAIANQSLLHAKSPAEFVASFTGRVQALAKTHALLTQTKLQGAEVMELVREQVLLGAANDGRISCSGPLLMLDTQTTTHLALVLHELATNARKYGALSVPNGQLSVSWQMRTNGDRSLLMLWKESSGPKVSAPRARGFGTTLIEQTLRGHGGEASIHYGADGLTCEIRLPLPQEVRPSIGISVATSQAGIELSMLQQGSDPRALHGKRVMLIEDEPLVLMDMESILIAAGCEIIGPAGTIEEAKRLVAEADCDIALVDVNLSGSPVDELAAALTRRNIPFAFVTGYGREALPQGFREAVMLSKPFNQDDLLAVAGGLLHRRGDVVQLRPRQRQI